ncbi:hypothetical protein DPEC_G00267950 [Dallia pectoralis]|uniref:Uncharacterized protein n=1 Tax=Dallia pectoralis TaxID=75939 RepID=A0ACC2FNM7_DALPE|nr:hypothetical protein DPEC_G00267950 [Dallia pectoralis]
MAATKRAGRNQLSNCYYEGFLEKRSCKDKVPRKLWTSLCGNALFFFNNKEITYVEKLDLSEFISLSDDSSRDKNMEAARFTLHMKDGDIQITAPSLETRELWKAFILSVVELSVPCSLNLLPGQVHLLRETVKIERTRRETMSRITAASAAPSHLYVSLIDDMPACYQPVSRTEAEIALERYSEHGNLMLRPGSDGASFAISTRLELNGSEFKHYRVSRRHEGGFAIDLETPILCATLNDVISCMVEKTGGAFKPFIMEATYEETIAYVHANEENGEKTVQLAQSIPTPPVTVPVPPPKPAPKDRMPFTKSQSETEFTRYLNDHREEKEEDSAMLPVQTPPPPASNPPRTEEDKQEPRKALKPPGSKLTPRCPRSTTPTVTDTPVVRLRCLNGSCLQPDAPGQIISEELKLKLAKRREHEQ